MSLTSSSQDVVSGPGLCRDGHFREDPSGDDYDSSESNSEPEDANMEFVLDDPDDTSVPLEQGKINRKGKEIPIPFRPLPHRTDPPSVFEPFSTPKRPIYGSAIPLRCKLSSVPNPSPCDGGVREDVAAESEPFMTPPAFPFPFAQLPTSKPASRSFARAPHSTASAIEAATGRMFTPIVPPAEPTPPPVNRTFDTSESVFTASWQSWTMRQSEVEQVNTEADWSDCGQYHSKFATGLHDDSHEREERLYRDDQDSDRQEELSDKLKAEKVARRLWDDEEDSERKRKAEEAEENFLRHRGCVDSDSENERRVLPDWYTRNELSEETRKGRKQIHRELQENYQRRLDDMKSKENDPPLFKKKSNARFKKKGNTRPKKKEPHDPYSHVDFDEFDKQYPSFRSSGFYTTPSGKNEERVYRRRVSPGKERKYSEQDEERFGQGPRRGFRDRRRISLEKDRRYNEEEERRFDQDPPWDANFEPRKKNGKNPTASKPAMTFKIPMIRLIDSESDDDVIFEGRESWDRAQEKRNAEDARKKEEKAKRSKWQRELEKRAAAWKKKEELEEQEREKENKSRAQRDEWRSYAEETSKDFQNVAHEEERKRRQTEDEARAREEKEGEKMRKSWRTFQERTRHDEGFKKREREAKSSGLGGEWSHPRTRGEDFQRRQQEQGQRKANFSAHGTSSGQGNPYAKSSSTGQESSWDQWNSRGQWRSWSRWNTDGQWQWNNKGNTNDQDNPYGPGNPYGQGNPYSQSTQHGQGHPKGPWGEGNPFGERKAYDPWSSYGQGPKYSWYRNGGGNPFGQGNCYGQGTYYGQGNWNGQGNSHTKGQSGAGQPSSQAARLQTHYQVLGVARNATQEEIKAAFRKLSLAHHPDKAGSGMIAVATAKMAHINAANDVLSDPIQRRAYDLKLHL